jgi:hypothetical protein
MTIMNFSWTDFATLQPSHPGNYTAIIRDLGIKMVNDMSGVKPDPGLSYG